MVVVGPLLAADQDSPEHDGLGGVIGHAAPVMRQRRRYRGLAAIEIDAIEQGLN
jgi:hypothetical protein